ncbi:GyrI-like domain-containing protein [Enterococcus timonensis]|uniref:GyrI-like domain-containing protein n=1 Tax=Enterococcus timonensis TaxID=1852364 RepID=UPI0008DB2FFB|nr:GyrI-like domain-containing protein [Enterococcus timonensis]
MTQFEIKNFPEITLSGYATSLPVPTMENINEVSKSKSAHFFQFAQSGKFAALMKESRDQIGFAISTTSEDQAEYFAGANTTAVDKKAVTKVIPAGDYLVLAASGSASRELFDQLIATFFGEILPANPEIHLADHFVVEALLNGNPLDSEVELRVPVSQK